MANVKITIEVPESLRKKFNKKVKKETTSAANILRNFIRLYVKK